MAFNFGPRPGIRTRPIPPIRQRAPQLNSYAHRNQAALRRRYLSAPYVQPRPARAPNAGSNGGAAPFAAPPRAPAPPATPPPAPPRPPTDPRDAQFFQDVATNAHEANSQIASLNQTSAYERAALAEALRRLGEQQPRDEQTATHSANNSGLLYSGALGQQVGDIRTDFLRRRTDAQNDFDRAETGRRSEIGRLEGLKVLFERQALLDAIARQTERDVDSPLVPAPEEPEPAPAGVPSAPRRRATRRQRTSNAAAAAAARAQAEAQRNRERQQQHQQAKKKGRR